MGKQAKKKLANNLGNFACIRIIKLNLKDLQTNDFKTFHQNYWYQKNSDLHIYQNLSQQIAFCVHSTFHWKPTDNCVEMEVNEPAQAWFLEFQLLGGIWQNTVVNLIENHPINIYKKNCLIHPKSDSIQGPLKLQRSEVLPYKKMIKNNVCCQINSKKNNPKKFVDGINDFWIIFDRIC